MIRRFLVLGLLLDIAVSGSTSIRMKRLTSQQPCAHEHEAWVSQALGKMETIKPGMTRKELLEVFTTEGGLSTGLRRTFVSRDCPYFKIDVEFEAVGRPSHNKEGRVTLGEDDRDVIVKVSRPYLRFSILD